MSKSFRVPLKGDPDRLVTRAEEVARGVGADFKGDAQAGSFSGSGVEGRYVVEGDSIEVTITKKPLVAPWSLVEKRVKSFFA